MKTIKIKEIEIMTDWTIPPERQGQIVEVSFALANSERHDLVVLRRVFDRSDRSENITAHSPAVDYEWQPWNQTPPLGRRLGRAIITP